MEVKQKKKRKTLYELFFKRFFDIVLSLLAIVVLSPVFLIVWIFSKICLGGKAILVQYRPGKNGRIFKFYKFRSMTNATDENGNLLPDAQRITKFGKIIRKLSVDELPQLFNILKGDMSIVGPRPRMVKDMIFYSDEVMKAYSVRPGLTSPCQVSGGRSESSWETIFEEDLKYAERITFWKDVKVIFQTVGAVFKSNASEGGSETSKRDYWYADYLLKTNQITKEEYDEKLFKANNVVVPKGKKVYVKDLIEE